MLTNDNVDPALYPAIMARTSICAKEVIKEGRAGCAQRREIDAQVRVFWRAYARAELHQLIPNP